MKVVLVRIDGEVEPNDLIILSCSDALYGGSSNAHIRVRPDREQIVEIGGKKTVQTDRENVRSVLDRLCNEVNFHWGGDVSAKRRNDREMIVQCSNALERTNFSSWVEGSGKNTVVIEDLG